MNLINEKAIHAKFGSGTIKSNEAGIIRIQFGEEFGEKAFIYPAAFEGFLTLDDPASAKELQAEMIQNMSERMRLIRESDRLKEEERIAQQDRAKSKSKPKTAKARAKTVKAK